MENKKSEDVQDYIIEQPVKDGLKVKTSLPVAMIGSKPDLGYLSYLESRLINQSTVITNDTRIVLIHNEHLNSIPEDAIQQIKNVYDKGACIVVVEPLYGELQEFLSIFGQSLGSVPADNSTHFCDFYIFNKYGDIFIQGDMHPAERITVIQTWIDENGNALTEPVTGFEKKKTADDDITPYEYGNTMDIIVKWLNEHALEDIAVNNKKEDLKKDHIKSSLKGISDNDVQKLFKAQTVTNNFPVEISHRTPWGENFTRKIDISITFDIYALYSFDQDMDYYAVNEEIFIPNASVYRGKWRRGNVMKLWRYCGYFMTNIEIDHYLKNGSKNITNKESSINFASPQTESKVTTITSGMSWKIGGSVGIKSGSESADASGAVSGGVSFNSSKNYQVKDIEIVNESGTDKDGKQSTTNARWKFRVAKLPTYKGDISISDPIDLSVHTAQFYTSWLWKIPNPKQYKEPFKLEYYLTPEYGYARFWTTGADFELNRIKKPQSFSFTLVPPNRKK
ncbi:MAG: hypothetical protein LBQ22_12100 [Bacteroidales bacterium]|jgi:hypothetical protein|nr:hypothetical protein [Bacteroidales bacterium]